MLPTTALLASFSPLNRSDFKKLFVEILLELRCLFHRQLNVIVSVCVAHGGREQHYKPVLVIPAEVQIVALSIPDARAGISS